MSVVCKVGDECGCGFKNTGADYSEVWDEFSSIIERKIDCEECKDHGLRGVSGYRDHVKVGIGGKPHSPKNYEEFANEVICVFERYKRRAQ